MLFSSEQHFFTWFHEGNLERLMSNLLLRNTQEVKDDNNALSIEIIVVDLSENGHTRFLVI